MRVGRRAITLVKVAKAYAAGITRGSFYEAAHAEVWCALEKLWHQKSPVELYCVAEELKRAQVLDTVGGYPFLMALGDMLAKTGTTAEAEFFLRKVGELAERRELIRAAEEAAERCRTFAGDGLGEDAGIVGALDRLQGLRVKSEKNLPAIMSHGQLMAAELPAPPMLIEIGRAHV